VGFADFQGRIHLSPPFYILLSLSTILAISPTSLFLSISQVALAVGETFYDEDLDLRITTLSAGPEGVNFTVSFGDTVQCIERPPEAEYSAVQFFLGKAADLAVWSGPGETRKVDVRLPGRGNSNSHGARPVDLIITMIKWIRTSR